MAALEAHLDGLRASTGLAADRLDYSCRVLGGWVGRGAAQEWKGGCM